MRFLHGASNKNSLHIYIIQLHGQQTSPTTRRSYIRGAIYFIEAITVNTMVTASRKRTAQESEDGHDDPSSKKAKSTAAEGDADIPLPHSKVDANGERYWEISKQRRVTVSSFKGKNLVNIREYYEKDGKELPGKKVLLSAAASIYMYI